MAQPQRMKNKNSFKGLDSTVAKTGSVFIDLLPCWCDLIQKSKDCHNEGIIIFLYECIKMPLKDDIPVI